MDIFKNFSTLFLEVWEKGILGVDIFQILIGLGIFLIFLLFRGLISKVIIDKKSGGVVPYLPLPELSKKVTN